MYENHYNRMTSVYPTRPHLDEMNEMMNVKSTCGVTISGKVYYRDLSGRSFEKIANVG